MLQVLLAFGFAMPRIAHVVASTVLTALVLGESALVVIVCWRRDRIVPGLAVCDVLFTAAALAICAWLTAPVDYNTWANFMYPFSLIEVLIVGLGLSQLSRVIVAALVLAMTYATVAIDVHGDPVWNVLPNSISYLANAIVSWLIAREMRRTARRLDDQRQLAVAQAEELTRTREHARAARLLHDRVLQTLEMLSQPPWIGDSTLRRQVAVEASWLRRFVEGGSEERAGNLLDTVHAVCDRHASAGLSIEVNDATLRVAAGDQLLVSPPVLSAAAGALHEALTNVSKHAGVSSATVSVAAMDHGISISVLDHGVGFDPARCPAGFGLAHSIRERICEVGGWARVEGWTGQGTHVVLWVPANGDQSSRVVRS